MTYADIVIDTWLNSGAVGVSALFDGGSRFVFYTGAEPTNITDSPTGTLLATCMCDTVCFDTVTANVLTFNPIDPEEDTVAGTAGYFRCLSSSMVALLQGTVGTGSEDMVFDSVTWALHDAVVITSAAVTGDYVP